MQDRNTRRAGRCAVVASEATDSNPREYTLCGKNCSS
jgi:hypothetical protein